MIQWKATTEFTVVKPTHSIGEGEIIQQTNCGRITNKYTLTFNRIMPPACLRAWSSAKIAGTMGKDTDGRPILSVVTAGTMPAPKPQIGILFLVSIL